MGSGFCGEFRPQGRTLTVSVAEMGLSQSFLRMGEVLKQEPATRLSDSQAGGREGAGKRNEWCQCHLRCEVLSTGEEPCT